ncbi:AMP-binding enzyme [Dietzia sp. NPDC055877]
MIGYPDPTFGEKGCAFIVPAPGQVVDIDELRGLCTQQLAAYKVPDQFEVVDSLPMTPAGKIRKSELTWGPPAQ